METPNEIQTELEQIAPLLSREIIPVPYRIPQGYFNGFSVQLMNQIRINSSLSGIQLDTDTEINEISPLLAGLKNKNPYQVPVGFFEELKIKIPRNETTPATLIEMPAKNTSTFYRNIRRLAVAASIIAVLGTAIYQIAFRHSIIQTDPVSGLAAVSDQDMANYLDSGDIHWTPSISSSTALADFTESDIHDLLSNVSDSELEQYLPTSDKKATVN
jgi:hypothetical protein